MSDSTFGFIGLGLIGGSIARGLRRANKDITIMAYMRTRSKLEQAKADGTIDIILDGIDETLSACDVIFLCTPVEYNAVYLEKVRPFLKPGALITDIGSTKTDIHQAVERLGYEDVFVGGHPMAGKEQSGYRASEETLFRGASMILVPDIDSGLEKLTRLCTEIGFARVVVTTASQHDRTIAYTSQLAHIVSSAYVKSDTAQNESGFSAGSFRDLTRVAYLNEEMWTELFLDNRGPLCAELRPLLTHLQEYLQALETGDTSRLRALLKDGRERKTAIENAHRTRV